MRRRPSSESGVPGWGTGIIGGVCSTLLGVCFLLSPAGRALVNLSYDTAFLFRSDIPVEDVVMVYMDQESHLRLKQDNWQRWDRGLHARLLDQLKRGGAKAVVFDVLFQPVTNSPVADAEFIGAVKRHGTVVVAAMAVPEMFEGQVVSWKLETPFPALKAVAAWGLVEVATTDAFVRQHYHRKDLNTPSLAWRAAQLTSTNPPPSPFDERWINYYGPPGMLPHYSYWEVLEMTENLSSVFSNKVIFVGSLYHIGMTGGKGTDDFRTPYSRWKQTKAPGAEINATAFLNLLRRDWLKRPSTAAELGILALCAVTFGYLLARLGPTKAVWGGLLCAVLVGVLANVMVWSMGVWFPWLIVSCVQVPCAAGWSALVHTRRLARQNRTLVQALAISRAGEHGAAQPTSTPAVVREAVGSFPAVPGQGRDSFVIPDHTLVRRIGTGAYGEVWLARAIIGTYHAAKIVDRRHFAQAAPFEREFNGLKRFTPISMGHPSLVKVLHVGRNDAADYIYYVMELADDETSGQQINPESYSPKNLARELRRRKGLPIAEGVHICLQLADALAYLHAQDLIHRDIKPSNIIFVQGVPKLADIGLVTQVAAKGRDVSYLGTEGYIPPEGPGTPLADIYSFGKLLYQVATGLDVRRFPELPTGVVRGKVDLASINLNKIIATACAVEPHKRYSSARELSAALTAVQQQVELDPPDSSH